MVLPDSNEFVEEIDHTELAFQEVSKHNQRISWSAQSGSGENPELKPFGYYLPINEINNKNYSYLELYILQFFPFWKSIQIE